MIFMVVDGRVVDCSEEWFNTSNRQWIVCGIGEDEDGGEWVVK